ncbi:MAG: rRNA maturation RNase YbeY [Hyphomicrobiales bacterium]|nr:rRNA maturation RNase YbeY [Hyphomicrobiales bacterium]MCP5370163.1 rRNA maturation RNase YbeY [Hyphomicrobiales bacterium]
MHTDVDLRAPGWDDALPGAADLCRAAAAAAFAAAAADGSGAGPEAEVCVVLADDAFVHDLNRRYRGIDKPTNVLSFPAGEDDLLGDVVLALETLRREAERDGKPLADHLCHLVVHGVLHLLGHDHGDAAEAAGMEALEVRVLAGLGVADPYAEDAAP